MQRTSNAVQLRQLPVHLSAAAQPAYFLFLIFVVISEYRMEQISFKDEDFCSSVKSVALAIEHGSAAFEFFCFHSVFIQEFEHRTSTGQFHWPSALRASFGCGKSGRECKDRVMPCSCVSCPRTWALLRCLPSSAIITHDFADLASPRF